MRTYLNFKHVFDSEIVRVKSKEFGFVFLTFFFDLFANLRACSCGRVNALILLIDFFLSLLDVPVNFGLLLQFLSFISWHGYVQANCSLIFCLWVHCGVGNVLPYFLHLLLCFLSHFFLFFQRPEAIPRSHLIYQLSLQSFGVKRTYQSWSPILFYQITSTNGLETLSLGYKRRLCIGKLGSNPSVNLLLLNLLHLCFVRILHYTHPTKALSEFKI